MSHTLPQIAKLIGADYRTLANWRKWGLFSPSVKETGGQGTTARYNHEDLVFIRALVILRNRGMTVDALARFAKDFNGRTAPCPICAKGLSLYSIEKMSK